MFHHCPWFWKTHILKTESKGIVVTKINHSRSLQGLPNVGPESSGESLDVPHEVDCFQGCTCQNEITISKLPKKISKKLPLLIGREPTKVQGTRSPCPANSERQARPFPRRRSQLGSYKMPTHSWMEKGQWKWDLPRSMTKWSENAMSLCPLNMWCFKWMRCMECNRHGKKRGERKNIQKSHVRLSVYDSVDVGLSRSMRCKELSTIFSQCFASMLVWNMRRQMTIQTKGAWVSNSHLGSVG